ncbi:MAG: tRNA(Ile)(2)-agmatinylcytidine synthase [Candidatus Thermoplasmatota archaeon]
MKTIWIGIDDTDSTLGGCTTFVARKIIEDLGEQYTLIGYPRLIRLNPNIPWKTRGNGALALHIGRSDERVLHIGEIEKKACFSSPSGKYSLTSNDVTKIQKTVHEIVEHYAQVQDPNTNPGVVFFSKQPSYSVYKKTVTSLVTIQETMRVLKLMHATYFGLKNRRGLIGATAAVAWKPKTDKTYEVIAYREKNRWGTPRKVDAYSVQKMDATIISTFDNYDYRNKHNRIVPNSPCPILFGIRGDNSSDLIAAQKMIISEKKESWILFETNQGTDDHIQRKKIDQIKPYDSVIVRGCVSQRPWTFLGGHVFFDIQDTSGSITCAAYEPTKEFRKIIRELLPGDVVDVYGGVRKKPLTINIEKIHVHKLVQFFVKSQNPVCPKCGKHMKSQGTNQGYKCIRCHTKRKKALFSEQERKIQRDLYEVPVCARRHLSKPLKRIKATSQPRS